MSEDTNPEEQRPRQTELERRTGRSEEEIKRIAAARGKGLDPNDPKAFRKDEDKGPSR